MNLPNPLPPLSRRTMMIATGLGLVACGAPQGEDVPVVPGEVEATEYQGTQLTPISKQRSNSLAGVREIDPATYTLTIDGMVDTPMSLSYADLQAREQQTWLMDLNCVEGWSYTAKWAGPSLAAILTEAGVQPDAIVAKFYSDDVKEGYTSLDVSYLLDNDIILGMKVNDLTLPAQRGFPFQVIAKTKYGYKWAKWVTRIELTDNTEFRGFWEVRGYHNGADDTGPKFG